MRKFITLFVSIIMLAAFTVPVMAASEFELIYHDFEGGMPTLNSIVPADATTAVISTEQANSGTKSVKFPLTVAQSINDSVAIEPGALKEGLSYTLAVRIKTVNYVKATAGAFELCIFDPSEGQNSIGAVAPETGNDDWKWYTVTKTMFSDTSGALAGMINNGSSPATGTFYMDDMIFGLTDEVQAKMEELYPTPPPEFDMVSFDFEGDQAADAAYALEKGMSGAWNNGLTFTTEQAYTGKQSLELDPYETVGYSFWYNAPASSKLVSGAEYSWAIKVKTVGHETAGLQWKMALMIDGGRTIKMEFEEGDNDWSWYVVKATFTPEELAKTVTLTYNKDVIAGFDPMEVDPKGKIYIDDFAFGLTADVEQFMADKDEEAEDAKNGGSTTTAATTATTAAPGATTAKPVNPANGEKSITPVVIALGLALAAIATVLVAKKRNLTV